jgi:hypothetical protein
MMSEGCGVGLEGRSIFKGVVRMEMSAKICPAAVKLGPIPGRRRPAGIRKLQHLACVIGACNLFQLVTRYLDLIMCQI